MKLTDMLPHFGIFPGGTFDNPASHIYFGKLGLLPLYHYRGIFYFGNGISGSLSYFDYRLPFCSRITPRKKELCFVVWGRYPFRNIEEVNWPDIDAAVETTTGWQVDKNHFSHQPEYHYYVLPWKPTNIIANGKTVSPVALGKEIGVSGAAVCRAANNSAILKGVKLKFE